MCDRFFLGFIQPKKEAEANLIWKIVTIWQSCMSGFYEL